MFRENISPTGSSTPWGTPTKPTVEPARAIANEVEIAWSVPTHSSAASMPTPSVFSSTASIAALGEDVWGAERASELLARRVAAERDEPRRTQARGCDDGRQSHGAVAVAASQGLLAGAPAGGSGPDWQEGLHCGDMQGFVQERT